MSGVVVGSRVLSGLAIARTKNSLPHLAAPVQMSMTILAERRYLRTER